MFCCWSCYFVVFIILLLLFAPSFVRSSILSFFHLVAAFFPSAHHLLLVCYSCWCWVLAENILLCVWLIIFSNAVQKRMSEKCARTWIHRMVGCAVHAPHFCIPSECNILWKLDRYLTTVHCTSLCTYITNNKRPSHRSFVKLIYILIVWIVLCFCFHSSLSPYSFSRFGSIANFKLKSWKFCLYEKKVHISFFCVVGFLVHARRHVVWFYKILCCFSPSKAVYNSFFFFDVAWWLWQPMQKATTQASTATNFSALQTFRQKK